MTSEPTPKAPKKKMGRPRLNPRALVSKNRVSIWLMRKTYEELRLISLRTRISIPKLMLMAIKYLKAEYSRYLN